MIKVTERKRLKFKDGYTYLNRNMIMDKHPKHVYKSLLKSFSQKDIHQYSDMWKTYELLANHLNVTEDKLLITRGVEGSIKYIFETLLDKGDTIAMITPTYAMYHVYSEVYGIKQIPIKGKKPSYTISVDEIKNVIPKINVLFIDNPKSHLPQSFSDDELNEIINYAQTKNVIVFLDEVYVGWDKKSYLNNLPKHDNLIIAQSCSKIAFPSLKAGWLITNERLQKRISSTRNSYELNYFGCKGVEWIIQNQNYIDDLKKKILDTKHRWYYELLSKNKKFRVFNSDGCTLRLYGDKDIIKKTHDNLYSQKIVLGIVEENNLVFSVTTNKEIEVPIFNEILNSN